MLVQIIPAEFKKKYLNRSNWNVRSVVCIKFKVEILDFKRLVQNILYHGTVSSNLHNNN